MRRNLRIKAWLLLAVFVTEVFLPTTTFALGSGPSQPEMASFTPAGTTEMVDPFTGDFSYNIPLMDVEGYPINIAYNSGVTMEQEASWVGLGWNLNVGTVNRSVRGLPDDFNGDEVQKETSMKPMRITKVGGSIVTEVFGGAGRLEKGLSFIYNNYKGFGLSRTVSLGAGIGPVNGGVGIDVNTLDGISTNANIGISIAAQDSKHGTLSIGSSLGTGYNTRTGQSVLSLGTTAGYKFGERPKSGPDERKSISQSGSFNSLLPIGLNSYTPFSSLKYSTKTFDFSGTIGVASGFSFYPAGRFFGSLTVQDIEDKNIQTPSYGYLYAENADRESLKDFNREKQVVLNKTVKNLSPVNFTYDVFSVSGQGVSGMFRPFRNDIGTLSDPEYDIRSSSSNSVGLEYGFGNVSHLGLNYNRVVVDSEFKAWRKENKAIGYDFSRTSKGSVYENVYFKAAGDMAESRQGFFDNLGGYDALAFHLEGNKLNPLLLSSQNQRFNSLARKSNTKRDARAGVFSYLTAQDAQYHALEEVTSNTGKFYQGSYASDTIDRITDQRKGHHISEITQIGQSGERYVFGIPAYNNTKQEVVYTVDNTPPLSGTDRINYNLNDASSDNDKGIDNHFSRTTTPAYAHSFLLTSQLSADYQDVTGDGISPDDLGNAYQFNYKRTTPNYEWRVPYSGATLMEGFRTNKLDQKASYTYGEKELWYVNNIQSKNQVAEFYTSERDDALGVIGEEGGKDEVSSSARTHRLDSIVLYDKLDRLQNKEQAIPIKKIAFLYDYSLCKKVENQVHADSGKLSLKRIEVSYGRSPIGRQSPYVFNYSAENPDYNSISMDRWGNYKPAAENPKGIRNADFPYSIQNKKDSVDLWANAWNLTKVITPSGGAIQVEYESDDYAYVQNRRAMQMFPVVGAGNSPDYDTTLAANGAYKTLYDTDYLYIELPEDVPNDLKEDQLRQLFLGEEGRLDEMYFKFLTSMGKVGYEYSPGYTSAIDLGYCADRNYVYVRIPKEGPNAISNSSFGYFRYSLFEVLYKQPNVNDNAIESLVKGIRAIKDDIKQMFSGVKDHLKQRNIANKFIPINSFIRLHNPSGFKVGGGSRVKRILMNDNWLAMSQEGENATYGQDYFYTTTDNFDRVISSGVASYEPFIGNEENPFRLPVPYTAQEAAGHIPAIDAYQEEPFGESFFPTARVGYSKVIVKNIHRNTGKTAKGITEHKFYTAKDFPVFVDETQIQIHESLPKKLRFQFPGINHKSKTEFAASQGYSIILNDMHGKPLSTKNFLLTEVEDTNGVIIPIKKLIGGKKYNYQFEETAKGNRLRNEVSVLTEDGYVTTKTLGVEVDVAIENRRTYVENKTISGNVNNDFFVVVIPPVPFPFNLPMGGGNYLVNIKESRHQVVTKTIQQYGIVSSLEVFTDQFSQTIYNRMYDGVSGKVILTETKDEHNQNEFQFELPAYLAQENNKLGPAYSTMGFEFPIYQRPDDFLCNTDTTAFSFGHEDLIKHGDEVIASYNDGSSKRAWIALDDNNAYKQPIFKCDTTPEPYVAKYRRLLTMFARLDHSGLDSISGYDKGEFKRKSGQILEEVNIFHLNEKYTPIYKASLDSLTRYPDCEVLYADPSSFTFAKSNHIYHSRSCNIADTFFYDHFDTDSVAQTNSIFHPDNNYDLSEELDVNDTSELGVFFNLTDTLKATLERIDLSVYNDSIVRKKAYSDTNSQGKVTLYYQDRYNHPSTDNYSTVFNPCMNFNSLYHLKDYPTQNFDKVDPSLTGNFNVVFESADSMPYNNTGTQVEAYYRTRMKQSLASFRIDDKESFQPYLEEEEQLYLIEYKIKNNSTGDIKTSYFVENGRGYEDIPYDDNNGFYINDSVCQAEDSIWDARGKDQIIAADSIPCVNNYRLMDRAGNLLNVSAINSLKIVRPANRNQLQAATGIIVSNKNPVKVGSDGKFEGFLTEDLDLKIVNANAQLYKEQQPLVHNYPTTANPFVSNQEGTFRGDSSFYFLANRSQSADVETPQDGYLEELPDLWAPVECYDGLYPPGFIVGGKSSGWKFRDRSAVFNEKGQALESVSNLNIPMAQVIDHKGLIRARAANSSYNNMAYDGFENYHNFGIKDALNKNGFRLIQSSTASTTTELMNLSGNNYSLESYSDEYLVKGIAHSGEYSMFVNRESNPESNLSIIYPSKTLNTLEQLELGNELTVEDDTITLNETTTRDTHYNAFTNQLASNTITEIDDALANASAQVEYVLNSGDSTANFKPTSGTYIISVWVKELLSNGTAYAGVSPEVIISNNGELDTLRASGSSIDGWMRIEGSFEYNASQSLSIKLVGGKWGAFFDDFRIHRAESNMNTYVYDKYSNRLKAILDENNYATYYEYDQAGVPTQVKRETEDGIYTVSESRQSLTKKF